MPFSRKDLALHAQAPIQGRISWRTGPAPAAQAAQAAQAAPRIRPTGCGDRPPRFPPRFPAGISPVTRVPGDSPAHNARPRRSPRNAISINHRNMKSTNFMQVRLHKTVEFCNIFLIFAKTLQISRKYFQFLLLSVNYGSTKPLPLGRKKSAAPGLGATLVQFGHSLFNLVMCAVNGAIFALWAISAPLTGTLAVTLAAPGTAQRRRGNCTTTVGDHRELHDNAGEL